MRNLLLRHAAGQHFKEDKRMILQSLWNVNVKKGKTTRLSIRAFAKAHACPYETMRRELKRGMEGGVLFDEIKREWFYPEYCAGKAQENADWKIAQKGTAQKFTNRLAEAFKRQIVQLRKSPAHARHDLIKEGYENLPCLRSIYNHIDHGDIGVLRGQTPYRPGPKRKRKPAVRRALKCPGNLSIEERPPEVAQRLEFGHWEMDTVKSRVGGRGGLLTLTERKTRFVIAEPLPALTARAVRTALRSLIRRGAFKTVLSITTDNGCEFLDSDAMAKLFKQITAELRFYYTHAYAAWEKGSVENANRHIRRFFPKGTDFRKVRKRQIQEMQNFINSIPRFKTLNGNTAYEAFNVA
jgi:IS30 family transposase